MLKSKFQIFLLLFILIGNTSCVRKIVYTYEDIKITRYDYCGTSNYFCNKSNLKNRIKITGYQSYYKALLCINRDTKKTWILKYDASIDQAFEDNNYFQAEPYLITCFDDPNSIKELQNIHKLVKEDSVSLEEKYAVYILCGVASAYTDGELEYNMKHFPNRYKSDYQRSIVTRRSWRDDIMTRIQSVCEEKY
jgi:hypothetical protein